MKLNAKEIKRLSAIKNSVYDDLKILFNAALKLLFQDKKIVKITGEQYSSYKLTNIGFETMKLMIRKMVGENTVIIKRRVARRIALCQFNVP